MLKPALTLMFLAAATTAQAEGLTADQTTALERVAPVIATQVEGPAGDTIATCIVKQAKRRELRKLNKAPAGGDTLDPTVVEISNAIMQRSKFAKCVSDSLASK